MIGYRNLRLGLARVFVHVPGEPDIQELASAALTNGFECKLLEHYEGSEWVQDYVYRVADYALTYYMRHGQTIPSDALAADLARSSKPSETLGIAAAVGSVAGTPAPTLQEMQHALQSLREYRVFSDLASISDRAKRNLSGTNDSQSVLSSTMTDIYKLQEWAARRSLSEEPPYTTIEGAPELLKYPPAQARIQIPSGLDEFDSEVGELLPGDMTIMMGISGIGKSWMCHAVCRRCMEAGGLAVLASAEMSTTRNLYRLAASYLGIDHKILKHRSISPAKRDYWNRKLQKILDSMPGEIIIIGPQHFSSTKDLRAVLAEISMRRQPDVVAIDYLGRFSPALVHREAYDVEWSMVGRASEEVKGMAEEMGFRAFLAAQTRPQSLKLTPAKGNLMYGFKPAQDADFMIEFRYAKEVLSQMAEEGQRLPVIREVNGFIVKARDSGEGQMFTLEMDYSTGQFKNLVDDAAGFEELDAMED